MPTGEVRSVYAVSRADLLDFYGKMDPERSCPPSDTWQWLYRPSFDARCRALVVERDHRVVAHAGIIPFWLSLRNRKVSAGWYVDFAVLPELQRAGLGRRLTLEWMRLTDVHVTFCNERSMGLFRKLGWEESFDTRLHHFFLTPLSHPSVLRRLHGRVPAAVTAAPNAAARALLSRWYGLQARHAGKLDLVPVSETLLEHFQSSPRSAVAPIRDREYLRWRFLESPYRSEYRVALSDGLPRAIVRERTDKPRSRHVEIMLVKDDISFLALKRLIAALSVWASRRDCAYLRYYESDPLRSRQLQRALLSYVHRPRFAFFAESAELMGELKQGPLRWQLADSDFEVTG
jgi:GNAT superfamily N-acetyltransferase